MSKKQILAWAMAAGTILALVLVKLVSSSKPAETLWPPRATGYAGSASCRECHQAAYLLFKNSHHALAEREMDPGKDEKFFSPQRTVFNGQVRKSKDRFELATAGLAGTNETFSLARAIGVDPLRQFLILTERGRLQTTELAVDPARGDWFDIFGGEDRQPGEWGHWTGRGMNWNSMCAACHNTGVLKNYDAAADAYKTELAEMGVGCEACHGPLAEHVAWRQKHAGSKTKDPTLPPLNRETHQDTCGSCHARREELTGNFRPGDNFSDHYSLTIPDETEVFFADGQIHEEDYEFTPFLGSRMHAGGIRCTDCHDPHSGKTRHPGDALCLTCHAPPVGAAPKIDPAEHSHHQPGGPGSHCVDCHMPTTTYMQRHARHDHALTIPDPLLTKRYSIPNACDRCHQDRGLDWQIAAMDKWYGAKMNRLTRTRTEAVAEARAGQTPGRDKLPALLPGERIPLWRASEIALLAPWCAEPEVKSAVLNCAHDTNALVRAAVARALEPLASEDAAAGQALAGLLEDPARSVRIEAAWVLRSILQTNSVAGRDLLAALRHNSDQPAGALRLGTFYFDRGQNEIALNHFRRAVKWDPHSAPLREALAVSLNAAGIHDEAVEEMKAACKLAPDDPGPRFKLGLALNGAGKLAEAVLELESAVRLDPKFSAAWYNLGLAHAAMNQLEPALSDLSRAETLEPDSARIPFARATVLARLGRKPEARLAAKRALELAPSFSDAAELLKSLSAPGG